MCVYYEKADRPKENFKNYSLSHCLFIYSEITTHFLNTFVQMFQI